MKLRILRLFLGLLLLPIFIGIGVAQEPAYLHYGVSDGLPSALVYCATQDHNGFLWFGTDKGLVRFDGVRFKVFGMKDGLPDQDVLNIFEDSKHRLWLSCFQNTPCYFQNGRFTTAENDSLLRKLDLKGGVFMFSEDKDKSIWITKDQRRYCKISDKDELSYFYPPLEIINAALPPSERKRDITIQRIANFGNQLYAIGGGVIINITDQNNNYIAYKFEAINYLDNLKSVEISDDFILLSISSYLALVKYEDGKFTLVQSSKENAGARVSVDSKGRFWVSTHVNGAVCFNQKTNNLNNPHYFLKDKKITNIFEDREGTFWFSTLNDGVYALPKNAALRYTKEDGFPLLSNNIISLTKLSDGSLAAGDDSGNIYFIKGKHLSCKKLGSNDGYNRILQIQALPENHWVAVSEEGIFPSWREKIQSDYVTGAPKSIYAKDDKSWFGTSAGLFYLPQFDSKPTRIMSIRTTALCADSNGNVWAGGLNGLYSQKDSFQLNWGKNFKPLSRRIISIKDAGEGKLWVSTSEHGLLKLKVKEGTVTGVDIINDKLAYPITNIQSMYREQIGNIWLASNTGAYSLDNSLNILHFNESNGLVSNNVNAILVNNDTLWAATSLGLSKILLKQQGEGGDFPTRIVGARYLVGNNKQQYDLSAEAPKSHQITLPAGASMLELDLAGLHFRTRGNLQFEYRTEEQLLPIHLMTFGNLFNCLFDKTNIATNTIGATQNFGANLTPGRFLGTATAILPGGIRSTLSDQITITILPYWWQNLWFILFIFAVVAYGVWRIIKTRSEFLKLQSSASELQLQAIKSQMNPHFVGNSINAIQQFFYPPDPIKASEYISIFSDLLRRTMDFAETDFISFEDELQYVKDYLEMVKLRFGDHFNYTIIGEGAIDRNHKIPAMLLQPILENATIHGLSESEPSVLTVRFDNDGAFTYCTITDNGVGIEESIQRKVNRPSSRPSRGLNLLNKKIQMLNQLYHLDLKINSTDLKHINPSMHGTKVVISFQKLSQNIKP